MSEALFAAAFPFAGDVLDLPVPDLDRAAACYGWGFVVAPDGLCFYFHQPLDQG